MSAASLLGSVKSVWKTTPIGDVCELISGQHILAGDYNSKRKGIGYLTGPADFGLHHPIVKRWTEKPKVVAKRNDILITVKGSGVGKVNLLNEDEVAISRQLMAIRLRENVNLRFVYFFLEMQFAAFQELSSGAAIPGISRQDVLSSTIPVPPLPEQERIVAILDEAFEGIATATAHAQRNLDNARELFQSFLQSTFERKGEDWVETTLGEATGGVLTGPFGSLLHKKDYIENGIPLVNPAHITDTGIEPDLRKTVSPETSKRLSGYSMSEGDIVIGRRGEMGRCAVITSIEEGWLCGTGSFFIKPSNKVDPDFLVSYLRSDGCRERLESIAGGAVMKNLSNSALSKFVVPLPSVAEQKAIVQKLDALSAETRRLEAVYQRKLAALAELKQSLLQRAFAGEL